MPGFGGALVGGKLFTETLGKLKTTKKMRLLPTLPSPEVLKAAVLRRPVSVRILILIVILAIFRRGRAAMTYTTCKVTQAISPMSFLMWCLGISCQESGNKLTTVQDGAGVAPARRRRGGWIVTARKGTGISSAKDRRSMQKERTESSVQSAALGEGGRLAAFEKLRELQQEGACCDVTLTVGGRHFKAHKCVLAAQSFPLRAMFEGAFKEGKEDVITLRDVESSTFALLLDFWYDRSVEITTNNVEALLDLSARYGVSLLRRHCCAFVARSANPSNSFSLLAVADRYDCRRLRKKLLAYTLQHFPLTCRDKGSDGFCHLPLALVADILVDDRLATGKDGEVMVFWAAVSWLEADRSRLGRADEVLSHVRFALISAKTLAEAVEAHPLLQSKSGKAFLHEAYRYQALPPESQDAFAKSMATRARPRAASTTALSVSPGGRGGRRGGRVLDRLNDEHLPGSALEEICLSGDESEGVDKERCSGVDHSCDSAPKASHDGDETRDYQKARVSSSSCQAEEVCEEGSEETEKKREREGPSKAHDPAKRSLRSGLLYV